MNRRQSRRARRSRVVLCVAALALALGRPSLASPPPPNMLERSQNQIRTGEPDGQPLAACRQCTADKRIALADRLFGGFGQPGSSTIRGRVLIMLGPPSTVQVIDRTVFAQPVIADLANIYTNVGPLGPGSVRYSLRPVRYIFTYRAEAVPDVLELDEFSITIEVDPTTGRERLPSRKAARELDTIFRALSAHH